MKGKLARILPAALLSACASFQGPDPTNLSAYCTAENAFALGSQGKAYFGVCPRENESAFLAGLQRGRALRPAPPQAWPYLARMEEIEKQLLAVSESERAPLRERLREAEFWALHIIHSPGSYSNYH